MLNGPGKSRKPALEISHRTKVAGLRHFIKGGLQGQRRALDLRLHLIHPDRPAGVADNKAVLFEDQTQLPGGPVYNSVRGPAVALPAGPGLERVDRDLLPPPVRNDGRAHLVDLIGAVVDAHGQLEGVAGLCPKADDFERIAQIERYFCRDPGPLLRIGKIPGDTTGARARMGNRFINGEGPGKLRVRRLKSGEFDGLDRRRAQPRHTEKEGDGRESAAGDKTRGYEFHDLISWFA